MVEMTEEEKERSTKEKNETFNTNTNNSNKDEEIKTKEKSKDKDKEKSKEKEQKEDEQKEKEVNENVEKPKEELFYINLEKLATFELPDKVFDICELKDGTLIACCLDKTLKIYDVENLSNPKPIKEIKLDYTPLHVASLIDGRIVVAFKQNPDFGIKIYKYDENKEITLEKEFVEHKKLITCLYVLEDGKIVTTSMDGTAVFYNPFGFNVVCKIEETKKKNFTSVVQLEDRSVVISSGKGFIYVLQ